MEERFRVLQTIYRLGKSDPQPLSCPCHPRSIILLHSDLVENLHPILKHLEAEGFIRTQQAGTIIIFITAKGIEKVLELNQELITGKD